MLLKGGLCCQQCLALWLANSYIRTMAGPPGRKGGARKELALQAALNIIGDGAAGFVGLPQGCYRNGFALCEKRMVNLPAPQIVGDANSSDKPLRSFFGNRRGRDLSGGGVAAQRARRRKISCSARNQIVHCTKILKTPV